MTYTIYALFDELEPGTIRYIGFSRDPVARHRQHLAEAVKSRAKSHRLAWIRKVLTEGRRVMWRELATATTADEAAALEIACIRQACAAPHRLVNGTEGGEGVQGFGGVLAPEALARRNASLNAPDYLERRSETSKAYWSDDDHREQHSRAMTEFWASPEGRALQAKNSAFTRQQLKDPNYTGGPRTPEARVKMSAAKLGKPHARTRTPEWNAKIAAAQKGRKKGPKTPEQRAAHAAAMNNPETRERMRLSALARRRKPDGPS